MIMRIVLTLSLLSLVFDRPAFSDEPPQNTKIKQQWEAITVPSKTPYDKDKKRRSQYLNSYRDGYFWAQGNHVWCPTNPNDRNHHAIRGWVEGWQAGVKAGGTSPLPAKYAAFLVWKDKGTKGNDFKASRPANLSKLNERWNKFHGGQTLLSAEILDQGLAKGNVKAAQSVLNAKTAASGFLKQHKVDTSQHDLAKLSVVAPGYQSSSLTWEQRRYMGLPTAGLQVVIPPRAGAAENVSAIIIPLNDSGLIRRGDPDLWKRVEK